MKGNDKSWGRGYAKEHVKVLPGKVAAAQPSMGTTKCPGKMGSAEPCAGTTDCGGR